MKISQLILDLIGWLIKFLDIVPLVISIKFILFYIIELAHITPLA